MIIGKKTFYIYVDLFNTMYALYAVDLSYLHVCELYHKLFKQQNNSAFL